jgi:hypothetical protein
MEALKTIIKGNNRRPKTIRFDQGGEFKSSVKKYLDKENIHVFYTQNSQIKSNYKNSIDHFSWYPFSNTLFKCEILTNHRF